jgi:hypothetical protein
VKTVHRYILCGEPMPPVNKPTWPSTKFVNGYGPCECAVLQSLYEVDGPWHLLDGTFYYAVLLLILDPPLSLSHQYMLYVVMANRLCPNWSSIYKYYHSFIS